MTERVTDPRISSQGIHLPGDDGQCPLGPLVPVSGMPRRRLLTAHGAVAGEAGPELLARLVNPSRHAGCGGTSNLPKVADVRNPSAARKTGICSRGAWTVSVCPPWWTVPVAVSVHSRPLGRYTSRET